MTGTRLSGTEPEFLFQLTGIGIGRIPVPVNRIIRTGNGTEPEFRFQLTGIGIGRIPVPVNITGYDV